MVLLLVAPGLGTACTRDPATRASLPTFAEPVEADEPSVPTLWDLLLPEDRRPRRFPLGHREYDPERVGYGTDVDDRGHLFGVALTDAERADLVEYLETL